MPTTPLTIDDHRIVTLTYEVRDGGPSGTLLERMDANYPFKFMFGTGRMLPAWERRLYGLKSGMGFSFQLAPADAYGMPDDRHLLDVPKSLFHNELEQIEPGLLERGQYITLTDADGKAMNAKILDWDEETVKLDANHALAGKRLFFSGAVLNVREATVDELVRKQYIEEGGVRR